MKKILSRIVVFSVVLALSSCANVENISYFQDIQGQGLDELVVAKPITIRPDDKISIIVNSRNMQIANLFNLPYSPNRIGQTTDVVTQNYAQGVVGYTVDKDGYIDFPVLGKLYVAGMTRAEIGSYIKNELANQDQCHDAVVTVDYMNLRVSVMGEVTRPGRYNIDSDKFTIFDALSAAGDLTIFGLRENVKVIRTVNGVKESYVVNLCSAREVAASPVYYLQQNDIIYVDPNNVRKRQSTVNGNNVLSTSFWMSIASLAINISYYFFK